MPFSQPAFTDVFTGQYPNRIKYSFSSDYFTDIFIAISFLLAVEVLEA